ncbi:hypothetical protein BJV74DRAFT_800170 [Russula compacta]|nr:hypothetical protein BJV74DRAFT_800170 [Russula compacta]
MAQYTLSSFSDTRHPPRGHSRAVVCPTLFLLGDHVHPAFVTTLLSSSNNHQSYKDIPEHPVLMRAFNVTFRPSPALSASCGGCACIRSASLLALVSLTGRLEVPNVTPTSTESEKCGLDVPDAWVQYMKKYICAWREGMHDLM